MTPEEAKKMEGTEFIFVFGEDGDTIPAYVKKFDPDTGQLTCYSLEPKTRDGWAPDPDKDTMPDGTFCLVGENRLDNSISFLDVVARTGSSGHGPSNSGPFTGCTF